MHGTQHVQSPTYWGVSRSYNMSCFNKWPWYKCKFHLEQKEK